MIGEKIKEIREAHGWSRTALAKACGTQRQNIEHLEKGTVNQPRYLNRLLAVLGVTYDDLVNGGDDVQFPFAPPRTVSIIPITMAQKWIDAESRNEVPIIGETPYTSGSSDTFAVIIEGESMEGGEKPFTAGEIVHCDPNAQADAGDFVLAMIPSNGSVFLRQLVSAEGTQYLSAQNRNFRPIFEPFRILAKAIFKTTPL